MGWRKTMMKDRKVAISWKNVLLHRWNPPDYTLPHAVILRADKKCLVSFGKIPFDAFQLFQIFSHPMGGEIP
jgi:hypothetical protein